MILELSKNSETMSSGVLRGGKMEIDDSAKKKFMAMFSQGLYKDPISSVVREWTSNALDSHTEVGVDEPVIVTIEQDKFGGYWFRVQDFGVGISPDRQENVVKKYGGTTKDQDEYMLGAYGLGMKSALAYVDSFTYTTRYDGVEYSYMMYTSEDGTNIDLIRELPTVERNGTIFNLKIKSWNDYSTFLDKAKTQLCYFEKVYFNCGGNISNDFKITKSADWKYSSLNRDGNLHLCLDNVYYPLDFNKLEISPINFNVGLNFAIKDGIHPIPSREDIQYTPTVIELIKNKIQKVANFFVTQYNTTVVEKDSYLDVMDSFGIQTVKVTDSSSLNLQNISDRSTIKIEEPKIKGIKLLNLRDLRSKEDDILGNYRIRQTIYNKRYKTKVDEFLDRIFRRLKEKSHNYILIDGEPPKGIKLLYIKDKYNTVDFITNIRDKKLGNQKYNYNRSDYKYLLDLKRYPKDTWRNRIKEFQIIEKQILDLIPLYSSIEPTADWLKIRKENRAISSRTTVSKEEINPKWGYITGRGTVAFESSGSELISNLWKHKSLVVYGNEDQKERLQKLWSVKKLRVVLLSDRDFGKMEKHNIHNWIKIEKFMEGNNQVFKRAITHHIVKKVITDNGLSFAIITDIKALNKDLADKMENLVNYNKEENSYISDSLMKEMLSIATTHNLFDTNIISESEEVSRKLATFDFLVAFDLKYKSHLTPEQFKLSVEILKGRKFKLNTEHYKSTPVLSPEEVEEIEDELTFGDEEFEEDQILEEQLEEVI